MSKWKKEVEEVNKTWNQIEPSELDRLRADISAKKQVRMNGRLQPRFFQVMYDRGVLKMNEWGEPTVVSPSEFTKWNRANSMIEAADLKESDSLFKAYPEEREAWVAKVKEWTKDFNKIAEDKRVTRLKEV